jgi:hypothetical protein
MIPPILDYGSWGFGCRVGFYTNKLCNRKHNNPLEEAALPLVKFEKKIVSSMSLFHRLGFMHRNLLTLERFKRNKQFFFAVISVLSTSCHKSSLIAICDVKSSLFCIHSLDTDLLQHQTSNTMDRTIPAYSKLIKYLSQKCGDPASFLESRGFVSRARGCLLCSGLLLLEAKGH